MTTLRDWRAVCGSCPLGSLDDASLAAATSLVMVDACTIAEPLWLHLGGPCELHASLYCSLTDEGLLGDQLGGSGGVRGGTSQRSAFYSAQWLTERTSWANTLTDDATSC